VNARFGNLKKEGAEDKGNGVRNAELKKVIDEGRGMKDEGRRTKLRAIRLGCWEAGKINR
jgi:hypothetical protein